MKTDPFSRAVLLVVSHLQRHSRLVLSSNDPLSCLDIPERAESGVGHQQSLAIEVSSETLTSLVDSISMMLSAIENSHDIACAEILLKLVQIIKAHFLQMMKAQITFANLGLPPAFAVSCRDLFFHLGSVELDISVPELAGQICHELHDEVLQAFVYGFDQLYPTANEQASYLSSLLRRFREEPRVGLSAFERSLMDLLVMRLSKFGPIATLLSNMPNDRQEASHIFDLLLLISKVSFDEINEQFELIIVGKTDFAEVQCPRTVVLRALLSHFLSRLVSNWITKDNISHEGKRAMMSDLAVFCQNFFDDASSVARNGAALASQLTLSTLDEFLKRTFFATVYPFVVCICALPRSIGSPLMLQIMDPLISLLRSVAEFRKIVFNMCIVPVVITHSDVIESEHPYQQSSSIVQVVQMDRCEYLEVLIDPKSCSVDSHDTMELFAGQDASRVHIGTFNGPRWNIPDKPIKVAGNQLTVTFRSTSKASPTWGYRLQVMGKEISRPFHWLHELTRTLSCLCGSSASIMLNGFDALPVEDANRHWLDCGLLNGSFESDCPLAQTLNQDFLDARIPVPTSAGLLDTEESDFLKEIENNCGRGAALLSRLNSYARCVFPIPASVKPFAQQVTRSVFAVILKHTSRADQALMCATEKEVHRPDDILLRLWRKASEMEASVATRIGQGYDRHAFLRSVLERTRFLLNMKTSKAPLPMLSLTRQSSGSMSHQFPVLLRGNSRSRNTVRRTLKAMRILRDDHYSSSSPPKEDMGVSFSAKDPDSYTCRQILQFVQDPSLDITAISDAVVSQRSRASIRLYAISCFKQMFSIVQERDLHIDTLRYLGQSLSRQKSGSSLSSQHLLSGTACAGKILCDALLTAYYSVVSFLSEKASEDVETLLTISLFNIEIGTRDFEFLHKIGVVRFLQPFICHDANATKWNIKMAAWSLFRLLAYVSARATASSPECEDNTVLQSLQNDILAVVFTQIQVLQRLRRQSRRDQAGRSRDGTLASEESFWNCPACTYSNSISTNLCIICASPNSVEIKLSRSLWPCARCTFLNKPTDASCVICDMKRKRELSLSNSQDQILPLKFTLKRRSVKEATPKAAEGVTASFKPQRHRNAAFWSRSSSAGVSLRGMDMTEPTIAVISSKSPAIIWTASELMESFSLYIESESKNLAIGVIPVSTLSTTPVFSLAYDGATGKQTGDVSVAGYGEPFGFGDVITVQRATNTISFLKNGVVQGVSFEGVYNGVVVGVSGQGGVVSLVDKQTFVSRSEDWDERISKVPLEKSCVGWIELELSDVGENGARYRVAPTFVQVGEIDIFLNQLLWLICRCSSSSLFQRSMCSSDWVRSLVCIVTDEKSNLISRMLALRSCRSIFPLVAPNSETLHKIGGFNEDIIGYLLNFTGTACLNITSAPSSERLWSASEMVALLRLLWLDDNWSITISNAIRLAIVHLPEILCRIEGSLRDSQDLNDAFNGNNVRGLTVAFGALSVMGSWIEPLREGGRVAFQHNGRQEEGFVAVLRELPFFIKIDRGSHIPAAIECHSVAEANAIALEVISEIDVLPETLSTVADVVVQVAGFLRIEETPSIRALHILQIQVKRMAAKILEKGLQTTLTLSALISEKSLDPLIQLCSLPATLKARVNLQSLEAKVVHLSSLELPRSELACITVDSCKPNAAHSCTLPRRHEPKSFAASGGQILAFGKGDNGRLGFGNNNMVHAPSIVSGFGPIENSIISVSCFSSHVVALTNTGGIFTWGKGDDGRLGHGATTLENSPRMLKALEGVRCVQVCAGLNFSFVLDEEGSLWGFGSNANGQLGIGSFPSQMCPIKVRGELEGKVVLKACTGGSHVLAITSDGSLYSWGKNVFGQLGHGTTQKLSTPKFVKAADSLGFVLIAGGWEHSMAVTSEGCLYTWGAGYEGNRPVCGHGCNDKELLPRKVEALASKIIIHIASGWDHSMAITNEGRLYTWGSGNAGMLGHGNVSPVSVPTQVGGPLQSEKCIWVDGGQDHTVAVTARGQLFTFGSGGAHMGNDVAAIVHEPQVIKTTPVGMVFGAVACGDKCTFSLSSQIPRTVSAKPSLHMNGFVQLPLYPLRLYLSGDPQHYFNNDNTIRDFSLGQSAYLSGGIRNLQKVTMNDVVQAGISINLGDANFNLAKMTISLACRIPGPRKVGYLFKLTSGHSHLLVSVREMSLEVVTTVFSKSWTHSLTCAPLEWHTVLIVGRGNQIDILFDESIAVTIDGDSFVQILGALSSGLELHVGPVSETLRDLAIWDTILSQEQIVSVVNAGMGFVASDSQNDEHRRQTWTSIDLASGNDAVLAKSGIETEGPVVWNRDQSDGSCCLVLSPQSSIRWRNPWLPTEVRAFTFIADIQSDRSDCILPLLSTFEQPESHFSWGSNGKMYFTMSEGDVCVEKHNWTRIVIVVDNVENHHALVYVNGQIAGEFANIEGLDLREGLIIFSACDGHSANKSCTVSIRSMQMFASALSPNDVSQFGSASDSTISSSLIANASGSLLQIGFPSAWVYRAMRQTNFQRYAACQWILQHKSELEKDDALAKLDDDAHCLRLMGIPFDLCRHALRSNNGDYELAIAALTAHPDFESFGNEVHNDDDSVQPVYRITDDDMTIAENPAYRCIDADNSAFPIPTSVSDSSLPTSVTIAKIIQLNLQLTIAYSRRAVLSLLEYFTEQRSVDFGGVIDTAFLGRFLRLMLFQPMPKATSVLTNLFLHALSLEQTHWERGNQTAPKFARFFVGECLTHLVGTCLRPDVTIDNEDMALCHPSSDIGIWLLNIFIKLHRDSSGDATQFVNRYLLCAPVVNLIFQMIVTSKGKQRLEYLLILSHLIRSGAKFQPSRPRFLRTHLFLMYDRGKDNKLFSTFFQALLELVLSIDQRQGTIVDSTTPIWNRRFSELHRLLEILLGNADLEWPPLFKENITKTLRSWKEFDGADLDEVLIANNRRFSLGLDAELISCIDRVQSSDTLNDPLSMMQTNAFDRFSHIDLLSTRLRCVILTLFNEVISTALPLINMSRTDAESDLARMIRQARTLIMSSTKNAIWLEVLSRTATDAQNMGMSRDIRVQIDRFQTGLWKEKQRVDMKGTRTCFGQIFHQLNHLSPSSFRIRRDERAFKVTLQGEFSDDYGGPYRTCLDLLCQEIQSPYLPLFVPCPNARTRLGINQDKYVPVASSTLPLFVSMYEFIGKLMGLAIRSRNLLSLDFPSIVWKSLVSEEILDADITAIDALALRIATNIEKMEKDPQVNAENFEELVSMNFSITGSDGEDVDLIPNGSEIAVTWANRAEFVQRLVEYRRREFKVQCDAMRRGLSCVVPAPMLSLFSWAELELMVCGRPAFNLDLLKSMTTYEWCSPTDAHIVAFWEVMYNRFDDAQRVDFLKFVWGRSRLPVSAADFDCKFKVSNMPKSRQNPDAYLPISHTCFFSIELPRYTSPSVMYDRLLYAITNCVSIDADSTSAAQNSALFLNAVTAALSSDDEEAIEETE
uniref:RanBP2-type domain-containing protein n=1 Tax=Spongospora subterranea TaxID=70186 RepID=A0A0H5RAJ7_9EUKA|eukprot:CRZ05479.1 hypothetical protein [Spongospora subterranea]